MTPKLTAILAVLIFVGVAYCSGDANGRARERSRMIEARVETLTVAAAKADTVYLAAKPKWLRAQKQYDTVRTRDTIAVPVPGKPESVTVYIPRDVADTAVQACRRLIFACDERNAAKDSLVAGLRLQIRTLESSKPGFVRTWGARVLWFSAGYLTGR